MSDTQSYIQQNKQRFLDELIELLKIASISADPAYNQDVLNCADAVAKHLANAGADQVEICETKGYPVVYGEKIINPELPTVLVYGHYDVQPADPLELWESGPFEPVVKKTELHPEGAIFARGSADDKGQFFMHVKAFEAMMKTNSLPCNIKFIIEGEEEVGSVSLAGFLEENKEKLSCDVILISDTHIYSNEQPTVTTGLRGLSYMEVEVEGPNRDLHSGLYGGAVPNPINVLAEMIAKLHDEEGRITIDGFYDNVEIVSAEDRAEMNKLKDNPEEFKKSIGLSGVEGETGYTTLERTSIRPTLDVNGIWGGYTGEGAKTVIPSKAFAKISMRLVPYQTDEEITEKFTKYFEKIAPASVKVKVTPHHGGMPYVLQSNTKEFQAAKKAMEKAFGKEVLPYRSGGSIPITSLFEKILGAKSVLMGFGLDSDAIHSPNEHYGLYNFYKGIESIPYFFEFYTQQ
ncbi:MULTISPECIES: dipeptidase [Cloacibacterium]|jgi:acetylornithine deacetylase/succinyl-diaminopimelate desuccinylase-like protein|uniref:Dipeptidase n=1 Tax=Cloacibacterium normanense TaxID=237258 RepID=A0A1E5UDV0_9FLAO|nr:MULTISPECIES: dipeptidase [Cloacibacterium]MBV2223900.1 dipeptidase [Cloacibacterium sp.]AZI69272.1 dipeptidase [Cloacibacterium normanense]OEL10988.1 peptidase M20/M25/M40 family protein [Cloacibacterium normanense]PPZ91053.1 dipeptidase [Cloacibacterium normanense]WDT67482.1 dipeptidase [Cloacibacterium sp. TD35]